MHLLTQPKPGAFDSREFIRTLLVGKVVQFNVLYNIPTPSSRDYGTVTLSDGRQLLELVVGEGWVKLRDDAGKKEDTTQGTELLEKLRTLEDKAKAESKGLWNPSLSRIENVPELSDPKAFAETWKGKPLDGKPL